MGMVEETGEWGKGWWREWGYLILRLTRFALPPPPAKVSGSVLFWGMFFLAAPLLVVYTVEDVRLPFWLEFPKMPPRPGVVFRAKL
jgi:hypothetical protein